MPSAEPSEAPVGWQGAEPRHTTPGRVAAIAIACLTLATVACDGVADDGEGFAITDSSGVNVVRFSTLAALDLPERSASERFVIGTRPGTELFRASGARLLSGRTLVVGNAGTSEILRFNEDGELIDRLGREGEGPGEFRDVTTLLPASGDTLVVYDVRLGRLSTFDGAGGLVGTRELNPPSRVIDLKPLAMDNDGRVLSVFGDARVFGQAGTIRDTTPLLLIDPSSRTDTLGFWPNAEWTFRAIDGGSMRMPVGFGRALFATGRNGRALLGSSDAIDVVLIAVTGDTLLHILGTAANQPVTADEVEAWRAQRRDDLPETLPEAARSAILEAPHHDTYPAFEGLQLDADGRIWVGEAVVQGATRKTWTVFEPDGRPTWTLTLPAAAEVLDAAGRRVVTLERDELGVEIIRALDLDDGGA